MNPIHPHVTNETAVLKVVVLGLPNSLGPTPTLEQTYDATSYQSIQQGIYPLEADICTEMDYLHAVLKREGVEVLRPRLLQDYNQIFARDVAFTIDNHLFVSNMIDDRSAEVEAFAPIFEQVEQSSIVHLPEGLHIEGGDVLLYDDYLFIGSCAEGNYERYKTARTNQAAIDFFRAYFPNKKVIALPLIKHDQDPVRSVLHLDCAFQPIAKGKAVVYPEAFVNPEDYALIESIFGSENLFVVTPEEARSLATNFVSLSPDKVLTEERFDRLNAFLSNEWRMTVIPIPYYEVSKQGGLLRCSTCPLLRA